MSATANKSVVNSALKVSFFTMLSRIAGLLRDMGLVMFFAPVAWALDSFLFAFTIPNLFRRLLGEGALAAAFIPEFATSRQEQPEEAQHFASSVITLLFVFTGAVTLLGSFACLGGMELFSLSEQNQLTLKLLAIMLPFACLVCTGAILAAISQSLRHFSIPAAMSVLLNLAILASLGYIAYLFWPGGAEMSFLQKLRAVPLAVPKGELAGLTSYAAVAVTLSGGLQLAVLYPALCFYGLRLSPNFNFRGERIRAVLKHMGPTAIGLGIVQINVLCDNLISYWLSTREINGGTPFEGATTYLFLGNRLMQLPLGVFAIAVATAAFPSLADFVAKKEPGKMVGTLMRALEMQLFILVPCAVMLIVLGPQVIQLLYQGQDLKFSDAAVYRTSAVLALLSAGLPFYGMQQVMTRAFYAVKDYTTPVKIAGSLAVLNLVLNLICIHLPDLYRHWRGLEIAGMPQVRAWGQGSLIYSGKYLALGEAGLALSTAFCAGLSVYLLWRKLNPSLQRAKIGDFAWKEKTEGFIVTIPAYLISGGFLGALVWFVGESLPYAPELVWRVERVVVPAVVAVVFYPVACSVFLPRVYEMFRRRLCGNTNSEDGDF